MIVVAVVVVVVVVLSINVIEVVFNWPLCCSFIFDYRQAGFKKNICKLFKLVDQVEQKEKKSIKCLTLNVFKNTFTPRKNFQVSAQS